MSLLGAPCTTAKVNLSAVAVVIGPPEVGRASCREREQISAPAAALKENPLNAAEAAKRLTRPPPLPFAKVTDRLESAPSVTVFPTASSILAVTNRVDADDIAAVGPLNTIFPAAPCTTAKVNLSAVAVVIGPP